MKRHVQYPGVRKWSGNDLLELQGEGLRIADDFFAQYGNCVICGCEVTETGIGAGLASIDGMVLPLAATTVEVFPVYLVKDEEHVQREYADDKVRDIAVRYYAKAVQEKPADAGFIEVTADGTDAFFDKIQATWLASIQNRLDALKRKDTTLVNAIELLKATDVGFSKRVTTLEKKIPSFMDHRPTVNDDNYDIGVEIWTLDEYGDKIFWKCHDNTEGKAVWKRSGEGGILDMSSGRFDSFKRVYWSGIRVNDVKVNAMSLNEPIDAVVLNTDKYGREMFVGKKGDSYYNNWLGRENFTDTSGSYPKFLSDVLYVSNTEVLVASADRNSVVRVRGGNGARIWTFEGLSNINNVNQSSDLWKALGVNSLSELVKLMDNHVFVDRISTADGKYSYFPCLLTYDGSNMVNIAIDSLRTRKIIGMYFLSDTVIRINSVYTLNLEYSKPVNTLTSTSTTQPLSANMGRQLSSQISSLVGTVNTINAWKNKMPEVGCVPIRNLARGQATPEESKVKEGWLAVYWIMANFSTGGEVSSPIIGSSSNALNNIEVPVMMGTGTKLKVTVGGMNNYANGFTVKNEQGVDVTNSYRLWGIVFGTK